MTIGRKLAFAFGLLAIATAAISMWFTKLDEAGYLTGIPETIAVVEPVAIDGWSGLREGCGVAVFRVSDYTLNEIRTRGLSFFQNATLGRDNGKYFRYQAWKSTPPSEGEQVLRALGCARLAPGIKNSIEQAATSGGSYFTTGYEYDLLLIPSEGYIVLTYSG